MKALLVSISLLVSGFAAAQFGDSMMDMQYGPFSILQRPDMRKELKLTKDQSKKLEDIGKHLTQQSQTGQLELASLKRIDDDSLAVLDDSQQQRFFEIRLQAKGATGLSDQVVAAKLELTDEQKASVKKIRKEAQNNLLEQVRKGSRDSNLMEKISKAEDKDLMAVLTEDQRKAFVKMQGVIYKGARMKGQWPI